MRGENNLYIKKGPVLDPEQVVRPMTGQFSQTMADPITQRDITQRNQVLFPSVFPFGESAPLILCTYFTLIH